MRKGLQRLLRRAAAGACLWACVLTTACGQRQPVEEDVALGLIVPLTRTDKVAGPPTVEGARLAVAEINAAGGVQLARGRLPLRLVVEDDQDRPELAVSKAFKLIEGDGVAALLGVPISHNAIAVARVAEAEAVPLVSTFSTHPETTLDRRWVFRVVFVDSFQGRLMADFAVDELAAGSAAVLVDAASPYSLDLGNAFARAFRERGGEVPAFQTYTADRPDLSEQLATILAAEPDVLFLPSYIDALAGQARQIRRHGIGATLLGSDTWSLLRPEDATLLAGSFYADVWSPDLPTGRSRRFIRSYEARFGGLPTSAAALAYDAVALIAGALERAGGTEPDAVRHQLAQATGFEGVTGRLSFSGGGDPERSAVIQRITAAGGTAFYRRIDP